MDARVLCGALQGIKPTATGQQQAWAPNRECNICQRRKQVKSPPLSSALVPERIALRSGLLRSSWI